MSKHGSLSVGFLFWLKWTVASILGLVLGWALTFAVIWSLKAVFGVADEDALASFILLPSIGISVGLFQWLVLRPHIPQAIWWVLASITGWAIGLPLAQALFRAVNAAMEGAIEGSFAGTIQITVFGVLIGLAQWLVLRQHVSKAGWWILASIMSLNVAFLITTAGALVNITEIIVVGTVLGALPGLVLLLLMYHSRISNFPMESASYR